MASAQERAFVREAVRKHAEAHFPELGPVAPCLTLSPGSTPTRSPP